MKFIKLFEQYNIDNIIENNEFQRWFDDSVMIDSDDKPVIFYHGSDQNFDIFDKNKIGTKTDVGWLGEGFYFYTDINEAKQYGKVNAYFLKILNPYYATSEENEELAELNSKIASRNFTERLISEGYDGVYYNGNLRGETVVFEPNQIWKI